MKDAKEVLGLDSEALAPLKKDIEEILQSTLLNMQTKDSRTATISISIGIELTKEFVKDDSITAHYAEREVVVPKIERNITSTINIKAKKKGSSAGDGYELIYDKDTNSYRIAEIGERQLTISDVGGEPGAVAEAEGDGDRI